MKTFEFKIDQNVVNYLERLSYDVESRERIVTRLIESHKDDDDDSVLNSKAMQTYQHQHAEAVAAYEIAKEEFAANNIPKEFNGHEFDWNLDFKSCTLTITQKCDCEITLS